MVGTSRILPMRSRRRTGAAATLCIPRRRSCAISQSAGNRYGDPDASDPDAGNGNFTLAIPITRQFGRGIDLSLTLYYNSRLWHRSGEQVYFDIDDEWPAPGWSLGFGRLVRIGSSSNTLLIDADGTRHPFTGRTQELSNDWWRFSGQTTDGALIDYNVDLPGQRKGITSAFVNHPNGMFVDYRASDGGSSPRARSSRRA